MLPTFSSFPSGWVLSESELRVWESLFQCAVTLTGKPYGIAGSIIERLNTEEIVTGCWIVRYILLFRH